MNQTEQDYISLCKRQIEEKLRLESHAGSLKQRDLEYLADVIEEKSGIVLSLSTLKRLWKNDYDKTPHPSTLQALVSLLGYKDWHEFKLHNTNFPEAPAVTPLLKRRIHFNPWVLVPVVVATAI